MDFIKDSFPLYNWIICNSRNEMLKFKISLFGVDVTLPAIFVDEDQALEVLLKVREGYPGEETEDMRIIRVGPNFVATIE